MALVRGRWTPVVGLVAGVFITVGFAVGGTGGRLTSLGHFGWFIGTWLQLLGLVVAVPSAAVAVLRLLRSAPTTPHDSKDNASAARLPR